MRTNLRFNRSSKTLYNITVNTDGNGTATASKTKAVAGSKIIITTIPNIGYIFDELEVTPSVTPLLNMFTMPESDVTVLVKFESSGAYTITVTSTEGRTEIADKAIAIIGEIVTLTSTPDEGYEFKEYEPTPSTLVITDDKFTMPDSNVIINAVFEELPPGLYYKEDGSTLYLRGSYATGYTKATVGSDVPSSGKTTCIIEESCIAPEDSSNLFNGYSGTTIQGLSYIDTSNATTFANMFGHCQTLTTLNISDWDISSLATTNNMFQDCQSLTTIIRNDDWNTGTVTSSGNMFTDCNNIVGAIAYDSTKVDVSYANPDTGYFTRKA